MLNTKRIAGYVLLLIGIFTPPAFYLYFREIGAHMEPSSAGVFGFALAGISIVSCVLFLIGVLLLKSLGKSPHLFSLRNILITLGVIEYVSPHLFIPVLLYLGLLKSYPFAGIGFTILIGYFSAQLIIKYFVKGRPLPEKIQILFLFIAIALCAFQFLILK